MEERNLLIILVLGSVRVWRGGEGKTEEPVLVTGWHLAPELVPQVKSYLFGCTLHCEAGKIITTLFCMLTRVSSVTFWRPSVCWPSHGLGSEGWSTCRRRQVQKH